jgi:integrase
LRKLHAFWGRSLQLKNGYPPIEVLLRAAEARKEIGDFKPLHPNTIRRQLSSLNGVLSVLRDAGYAVGPINLEVLRPPKVDSISDEAEESLGDPEDEVHVDPKVAAEFTFLPLFTGAGDWDKEGSAKQGSTIYQSGLYWCPLLYLYAGLRRSEAAALAVEDIRVYKGVHYLTVRRHLVGTVGRGLKNKSSKRDVPLHPELIRLGLLDYVEAIRALGHAKLFPELINPFVERNDAGSVLYKKWQQMSEAARVEMPERPFHRMRGAFISALKAAGVAKEFREELAGHANSSVNIKHYTNVSRLPRKMAWVKKYPSVTLHLQKPKTVTLLPFVAANKPAPWFDVKETRVELQLHAKRPS